MPEIVRTFNGKMNTDMALSVMPPGDYIDALNISPDYLYTQQSFNKTNIVGNRVFSDPSYTPPLGNNITIGGIADNTRNRVIDFMYNDNGFHQIREFDFNNKKINVLINNKSSQTGNIDILKFSPDIKVHSCDILIRDPSEGDLLFWLDGNQPRELNIDMARGSISPYPIPILPEYLEKGKRPPLSPPTASYRNDTTVSINNFRKKLFQFAYRWVYDNYEKSTWSPISKIAYPNGYTDPSIDMVTTNNNRIDVGVQTGNGRVKKIEIAARVSIGSVFSDYYLIAVLDKYALSILNNSTYTYSFYNNGSYPPLDDIRESTQLYDYIPLSAGTLKIINGNVLAYADITEGYNNNTPLNVTISVTSEDGVNQHVPITSDFAAYNVGTCGSPQNLNIQVKYNGVGQLSYAVRVTISYKYSVPPPVDYQGSFDVIFNAGDSSVYYCLYIPGWNPSTDIFQPTTTAVSILPNSSGLISIPKYSFFSKFLLGIVYFDSMGRNAGVITNDSMQFNTPPYSEVNGIVQTPVINISINHTPPPYAVKYCFVRSNNMTFSRFFYFLSESFVYTTKELYIKIQNLTAYQAINPSTNLSYSFTPGDRIRLIKDTNNTYYSNYDFEIIGVVVNPTVGSTPYTGTYIKARISGSISINYNSLFLVYTPAISTDKSLTVFYEFGETYDIVNAGTSSAYHKGMNQDQVIGGQPATFTFRNGDVYLTKRTIPSNSAPPYTFYPDIFVMDRNYSDSFPSSVNDNGRPFIIDINAKQLRYPTLLRISQPYISGTNVNGMNRFYYEDMYEYDRKYGAIRRLSVRDRQMRVYQEFKVGWVPIYQQVIKDTAGNDILAQSDRLLNNIQYYVGNVGIGDAPSSLASEKYADYFVDTNLGAYCRLSLDGIIIISLIYQMNSFAIQYLKNYKKSIIDTTIDNPINVSPNPKPTIYGVYDSSLNQYITALEKVDRWRNVGGSFVQILNSPAKTLAFSETKNAFTSFYSFNPEWMVCLNNTLITFKNGQMFTHDNTSQYCNFYGVQYDAYITGVFNDNPIIKKNYISITETSNTVWECDQITTSTEQVSSLIPYDFEKIEGQYHASFLYDMNSTKGIINGDDLNGTYIVIRFRKRSASSLYTLFSSAVKYFVSYLNNN